jgi:hypothetical protein
MIFINLVQLVKRGKQLKAELHMSWKPFQFQRAPLLSDSCGGHRVQNLYHSGHLISKGRNEMSSSENLSKKVHI